MVVVGSCDGNVYCLNASDGKQRWMFPTGDEVWSSPAILNNTVYIGSNNGCIYGIPLSDPNGDGIITETELIFKQRTDGPVRSSPAAAFHRIAVGSDDGNVYCLNSTTGEITWVFPTGDQIWSSPAITVDGKLYIGSRDHTLYCISIQNGHLIWSYVTNGPVCSSPTIVDGKLFIGVDYDGIYCFEDNSLPYIPSNPSPPDSSGHVNVYTNLSWIGGDPDGDPVTYTVYFKMRSNQFTNDDILSENQTTTTINPGSFLPGGHMQGNTKYFWKIVAYDTQGHRTDGSIWCFKTAYAYESTRPISDE